MRLNHRVPEPKISKPTRMEPMIDGIAMSQSKREWSKMGNEEIVGFAKKFVERKGMDSRRKLQKADSGLYQALRKRKLLYAVFSDVEPSKRKEAVNGVLEKVNTFNN